MELSHLPNLSRHAWHSVTDVNATLLRRGLVVDPESATERITDLLVSDGKITDIGDLGDIEHYDVIDAEGLVIGPGFIDVHSHVNSIAGQRLQALDGVTTALDLESGLMPIDTAYAEAATAGRPLNFGFSASWSAARAKVLAGIAPTTDLKSNLAHLGLASWQGSSTQRQLNEWLDLLADEISLGALGIGVLMGYAPRSDPAEFLALARLAAAAGVPTFTHVREIVEADPSTPIDGTDEIVRAAGETGAHMHHCHVNSTSRRHIDRVLQTIERTRTAGSSVSVETYPYGAGSTAISAAFLAPDRLPTWGLKPSDLVVVETGERIADLSRLKHLRATDPGLPIILHYLDETREDDREMLYRSLAFPDAIVASDAMPVFWADGTHETTQWPLPPNGTTHPRTAGTFSKALRLMVRERSEWTWAEAFRRCSYLPAEMLRKVCPDMRLKGRVHVGADADLVILDPARVSDSATYFEPTRPSTGVRYLFVNGTAVVADGMLDSAALPGRPVRGRPQ